jgi:redox-sensitive bicupin YhaK (pirin superfamily)
VGSIQVAQDVSVWVTLLGQGERRELALGPGRHAWIHLARGSASVNGTPLGEGDGAGLNGEERVTLTGGGAEAEVLVFDLV